MKPCHHSIPPLQSYLEIKHMCYKKERKAVSTDDNEVTEVTPEFIGGRSLDDWCHLFKWNRPPGLKRTE